MTIRDRKIPKILPAINDVFWYVEKKAKADDCGIVWNCVAKLSSVYRVQSMMDLH